MQFLKGLLWFLLAMLIVIFSIGNWTTVPIKLWGGLVADVNLPLLLVVMFLLGLVPTLLYQHAVRWRLRGRLANADRTIADLRAATLAPPASATTPPVTPIDPGTAPAMPPGSA